MRSAPVMPLVLLGLLYLENPVWAQPPTEGLVLWLDADAGVETVSGAVERWGDQSIQNNDALQGNPERRPLVVGNALNGHAIIRFDGADDGLGLTGTAVMNNISLVIVQKLDSGATGNAYYPVTLGGDLNITGQYTGLETRNGSSADSPDVVDVFAGFSNDARATYPGIAEYGTWRIISIETEQFIGNTIVRMNGALAGMSTTGANVAMSVQLGNATGTGFGGVGGLGNALGVAKCDVAEVLVYDRVLAAAEVSALEGYLSSKFAIQLIPPPEPVEGPFAMQFDGTDHVRIPHSLSIDFPNNSESTMELWVYFPIGSAPAHILGKRPGCGGTFYQVVHDFPEGSIGGGFVSDVRHCDAAGSAEEGVWTHLAFVAYPDTAISYVNGVRMQTAACEDYAGTTADLLFGRSGDCAFPYVGLLDEVRFWNVARTGEEISENYLCVVDPETPGLVGYWNFDEDQFDQNVLDRSSLGNHGTLGNHAGSESQDAVRVVSTLSLCPVTPPAGGVEGTVLAGGSPLANVTVDLVAEGGAFIQFTATNGSGSYSFADVPAGPAEVSIIVPLGYLSVDPESGVAPITIVGGETITRDFTLEELPDAGPVRDIGYWKHEARVHTTGQGNATETLEAMSVTYPTSIFQHFYENELISIAVEGVTFLPGPVRMTLQSIRDALDLQQASTLQRAKQHYLALLLNVASNRLRSTDVVSADGAAASQAIQQIAEQINDGQAGNDGEARDLAKTINSGLEVPAGVIDLSRPVIPFAPGPIRATMERVRPNPMTEALTLEFDVREAGEVEVVIYDAAGRHVRTLSAELMPVGRRSLRWDGRAADGKAAPNGVYFYRIAMLDRVVTSKFVVMRAK